jgi:hypothetical protein
MDEPLPVTVDALEVAVTVPSIAYRPNKAVIAVLTDRFIEIRRQTGGLESVGGRWAAVWFCRSAGLCSLIGSAEVRSTNSYDGASWVNAGSVNIG